jgi:3-oxoacyl-[acyl-carrier protein] reductase
MNIRFDNRVVIVTGAAHGFGRAIALRFAGLGARVIGWDIAGQELEETAQLARADAGIDVRVEESQEVVALDEVHLRRLERLRGDFLVNDGGVLGQMGRPIEDVSPVNWRAIVAVNLDLRSIAAASPRHEGCPTAASSTSRAARVWASA